MQQLHAALAECGIRVNRWDGAGAIAAALMKKHGVKQHIAETPQTVTVAASHAYFGGRIEAFQYGHTDRPIYSYDINSAYPTHIATLPSLAGGTWVTTERPTLEQIRSQPPFSVYHVSWDLSGVDIYPFPYRTPLGDVMYPSSGETWVWQPELYAYLDHVAAYANDQSTVVHTSLSYHAPADAQLPFAFVPELYATRQQWVKDGRKAEKVLKLGLNSLYGKLAQQIGGSADNPPPYHQLSWAGYVTSCTRASLYRAAMQSPHTTIMIATDGIYGTSPYDVYVPAEKQLGAWERTVYDGGGTIVQSGVYWLTKNGMTTARVRGFSADYTSIDNALTEQRVLAAWTRGERELICQSSRTFVGFGQVASKQRPYAQLGTWQAGEKALELYPTTKRWTGVEVARGRRSPAPHARLEWSESSPNLWHGLMSKAHVLAWLDGGKRDRELRVRDE